MTTTCQEEKITLRVALWQPVYEDHGGSFILLAAMVHCCRCGFLLEIDKSKADPFSIPQTCPSCKGGDLFYEKDAPSGE